MVIEKDFVSVKRAGRQRKRSRVKVVGVYDSNRTLSSQSRQLRVKAQHPGTRMDPEWNSTRRVLPEFLGISVENQKERLRIRLHVEVSQFAQNASPVAGLLGEITEGEYEVQRKSTTVMYRNTRCTELNELTYIRVDTGSTRGQEIRDDIRIKRA